jgi:hypothetical protein
MANKFPFSCHGLALSGTIAAVVEQNRLMKISADETFAEAGANEFVAGRLVKVPDAANGLGTVETPFKELVEIVGSGALVAGGFVKMAAASGGNQRVTAWVDGTDSITRLYGIVFKGGADGATVKVLVF